MRINDLEQLLATIEKLSLHEEHSILDVGCGYGDLALHLMNSGFNVTGVDISPELVDYCRGQGIRCVSPEELEKSNAIFDVVVMSHVIEHFMPLDLLHFVDSYLDRLKMKGILIISTPLMTPYFYHDFDHVKPYHPQAIRSVFVAEDPRVQYISRNMLQMLDIWWRKTPFVHRPIKSNAPDKVAFLEKWQRRVACWLFRLSGGLISRTDGWIGVFRKVKVRK